MREVMSYYLLSQFTYEALLCLVMYFVRWFVIRYGVSNILMSVLYVNFVFHHPFQVVSYECECSKRSM